MPFGILQQRIERAESWANSCKIQSQASTLTRFIRNEIQPFCEFPEELLALQILKDHVYTIQAKLPEEMTEGGANA